MLKSCLRKQDVKKIEKAIVVHKPIKKEDQEAIETDVTVRIKDRSDLSSKKDYYRIDDKWYKGDEKIEDEEEITKLEKRKIPLAWDNVLISSDPNAKLQAVGQDFVGRWQYRYSQEFIGQKKQEKFDRVKLFGRDIPNIRKAVDDGALRTDVNAMLLKLEDKTAIRIGSKADTKAKEKAYGLTTLKNKHVTINKSTITLDFIAKKGIRARYTVEDGVLAQWLKGRKKTHSEDLFPDTSAAKLNSYLKEASGGKKYTVKDFRTYHGTRIAYNKLKKYENVDLTSKEKKGVIKDVCKDVSDFLHNTPTMAKESYINPMVWELIGGIK